MQWVYDKGWQATVKKEPKDVVAVMWFYVNSWGRAKIEKLEIVSECESSGTIFMYYRTEFFS